MKIFRAWIVILFLTPVLSPTATLACGNYPIYVAEQPGVGNKVIAFKNCHNALLRDFSILKGGHFGMLLTGVERADFFAVTAPRGENGAFALDRVRDFRIGWSRAAADAVLPAADGKTL